MSTTIDERIVEMQFDNQQFESGVKESIGTLDKLKESLKLEDSAKGLEKLGDAANSVDLSNIDKGVSSLADAFSSLGVVGQTVLQNLTNKATDFVLNLTKSLSTDLVGAGMNKYEQSLKAVQKIMAATGDSIDDVQEQLDMLMWFTDETSYSFIDMANNIGVFTSYGIDLKDASQQMVGVATAAGLAGAETSKASHAMTGFAQALGKGYMDRQVWNSWIKTAGLQTEQIKQVFIEAGVAAGTLKQVAEDTWETTANTAKAGIEVTNATFAESLSDAKWMSSQVIQSGLAEFGKYALRVHQIVEETGMETSEAMKVAMQEFDGLDENLSVKAFKMAQEARTFGDAISAVKDAVSTNWMEMFQLIFGNYEESVQMWTNMANNLWEVFVPPIQNVTSVLKEWRETVDDGDGSYGDFVTAINNSFEILAELADRLHALSEGFLTVTGLQTFVTGYLDATERIKEYLGLVDDAADEATDDIQGLQDVAITTTKSIDELAHAIIDGLYGNGEERRRALEKEGYSWQSVRNRVNELLGSTKRYDAVMEDVISSTEEYGWTAEDAQKKLASLALEFDEVVRPKSTWTWAENLQSTIKGAIALLDIFGQAISAVVRVAMPAVEFGGKIGEGLLGITGTIGDLIINIDSFLKENDLIYKGLKAVSDFIGNIFGPAFEKVGELFDSLANRQASFQKMLSGDGGGLPTAVIATFNKIGSIGSKVGEIITAIVDKFKELEVGTKVLNLIHAGLDKVFSILGPVGEVLSILLDGIKESIVNFSFDGINNSFEKLKDQFGPMIDMFKSVKRYLDLYVIWPFKKLKTNLMPDWYKSAKAQVTEFATIFNWSTKAILDDEDAAQLKTGTFIDFIKSGIGVITYLVQNVGGKVTDVFNTILPLLDAVGIKVRDFFSTASIQDIIKVLTMIASLIAVSQIGLILSIVKKLTGVFSGLFSSITGFFNSMKAKVYATTAIMFAAAIGILAFSLYQLAQVPAEDLVAASLALGTLMVVMANMIAIAATQGVNTAFAGGGMLAMTASILLIIQAMKQISELTTQELESGMFRVAIIMAELIAVSYLLGKTGGIDYKHALGLFIFVTSIKQVIKTLDELADMDLKKIAKGTVLLFGVVFMLTKLMKAASDFKDGTNKSMLFTVMALWLFVKAIENLEDVDYEALYITLSKLSGVFVAFFALAAISRLAGPSMERFGGALAGMGIAIVALAFSIKMLSDIEPEALNRASATVYGLMAFLDLFVASLAILQGVNPKGIGKELILAAVAIALLAVVIWRISEIDDVEGLERARETVYGLMAFLAALTAAIGYANKAGSLTGSIIALAVLIAAIAGTLYLLDRFGDVDHYLVIAESLALVIGALGFAGFMLGASGYTEAGFLKNLGMMVTLGILLAEVGAVFVALDKLDVEPSLETAESLAVVLLALAAAISVMTFFHVDIKSATAAAVGMGEMIGIIGGVLEALALLKSKVFKVSVDDVKEVIDILDYFITGVIGAIGEGIGNAIAGVGNGLSEFADNAERFFNLIAGLNDTHKRGAGVITEVVKSLVDSGVLDYRMIGGGSNLTDLGKNLRTFGVDLVSFISALTSGEGGIDEDQVNQAVKALQAVSSLSDIAPELQLVADLGALDYSQMSTGLTDFADAIVAFSTILNGDTGSGQLHVGAIQNSVPAVKAMSEIATYANDIQATSFDVFVGFGNFSTGMTTFASAMVEYGQIVAGKTESGILYGGAIRGSVSAAEALTEIVDLLPRFDGIKQLIEGEVSWTKFATGLGTFGRALVSFSTEVKNDPPDKEAIQHAIDAAQILADFESQLTPMGGLIDFIVGRQDWDSFTKGLYNFGVALRTFSKLVAAEGAIKIDAIQNAVDAATVLMQFKESLPDEGGFLQRLFGEGGWGTFAEGLHSFGVALVSFGSTMTELDTVSFYTGTRAIEKVIDLGNQDTIDSANGLIVLGTLLTDFKETFKSFYDTMTSADGEKLTSIATSLVESVSNLTSTDLSGTMSGLAGGMLDGLTMGISANGEKIQTIGAELIQQIITAATGYLTDFTTLGLNAGQAYYQAFESTHYLAQLAGINVTMAVYDGIKSNQTWYENAGRDSSDAFIAGLNDSQTTASEAGEQLANAGVEGLENVADSFSTTGETSGTNYSDGISSKTGEASSAAETLAGAAINALNDLYGSFFGAGANASQGFVDGIGSKLGEVQAAAEALGSAAAAALNMALDINSPSKVFKESGKFAGEGFALGLRGHTTRVEEVSTDLGYSAVSALHTALQGLSDVVDEEMHLTPTIEPIVDLTNAKLGAEQISTMFGGRRASIMASQISAQRAVILSANGNDISSNGIGGTQFNFTQNNYSPKALSRIDIYRNTKNQFAQLKGLVDNK